MKVLIATDSFKNSLSGARVAEAIARGIKSEMRNVTIHSLPLADGGEGTVDALVAATNGNKRKVRVHDPLMREIEAEYGVIHEDTAVIEMAAASGIGLLSKVECNPMITTTYGTGELIKEAIEKNFNRIIVGVGGSATNDAGAGMAEALGAKLLDKNGEEVEKGGGQLDKVTKIDLSGLMPEINNTKIIVAVDVRNTLTGPYGATRVYAPQKGADESMVEQLENNLNHFAQKLAETNGRKIKDIPGSGAAGGLAAGLAGFLDASIQNGFNLISELIRLEDFIKNADLVITGEGMIDNQTGYGKTPHGVASMAKKYNIPVVGFAGTLGEGHEKLLESSFDNLYPITEKPVKLEEAIHKAEELLMKAAARMTRSLVLGSKLTGLKL
ncbi:MAG: glycerate kinase [Bacteroidales bacterium]|nr:glycerate kinase [Bacteroidales bacterium]MCF8333911.1 glycerate kinase [Bacteroidales bacterium]